MRASTILIVDDEAKMREVLSLTLEAGGHRTRSARDGRDALRCLTEFNVDLVITDLKMPDIDGHALLARIKAGWPQLPVVVITAHASLRNAVSMIKDGAFDYIGKPFEIDELEIVVKNALALRFALGDNQRLRSELNVRYGVEGLIGTAPSFRRVIDAVSEAAHTRANVLLTGESGTGKEVVARAIHYSGPRRDRPFVVINCAAIPETLLESELFGHVKGAFTGALTSRPGHFAVADGGTLFLDEIGDMPLAMQAKILRVLQDRVVTPVGGSQSSAVDVRIIAATNRDLQQAMRDGQFRNDLFYRLNVFAIELPPLRERADDIAPLAEYFVRTVAAAMGKPQIALGADALSALRAYPWPGNVRELENCMERALISARGRSLSASDLPTYVKPTQPPLSPAPAVIAGLPPDFDLDAELERVEREYVIQALAQTNGVQVAAARLLRVKERSLWHRIKKLGIRFVTEGK